MYDPTTERLLALLPTMTEAEFSRLALACADQAGASVEAQEALRRAMPEGE